MVISALESFASQLAYGSERRLHVHMKELKSNMSKTSYANASKQELMV
jgi:hypothetical protein